MHLPLNTNQDFQYSASLERTTVDAYLNTISKKIPPSEVRELSYFEHTLE